MPADPFKDLNGYFFEMYGKYLDGEVDYDQLPSATKGPAYQKTETEPYASYRIYKVVKETPGGSQIISISLTEKERAGLSTGGAKIPGPSIVPVALPRATIRCKSWLSRLFGR